MAESSTPVEFRISTEPLPVPAMDDIGPVPLISPDSQSFVVIRSGADFDDLSDDNDISDMGSILQEHKQILQDELAQLHSHHPQPSLRCSPVAENQAATTGTDKITNGKIDPPKFIIEQTMSESASSGETMIQSMSKEQDPLPQNNKCPGDDVNRSVLPAMPQPQMYMNDNDQIAISIVSFAASDFGSEEIQSKVIQLIEENTHLKDTISKNNSSMKEQYDRIVAWQKDVERVHNTHKEKFREAKKCIETLKLENDTLKKENDNIRYTLQVQQNEHDKTKQLLTETSEHNLKEFELEVANKKVKELEGALKKLNIHNDQQLACETAKWKAMEDKLQRYENELENAYKQIRAFEKGFGEQERPELGKLKLIQEKLLLSEMANERANKEILSLRSQMARNVQTTDDSSKLQVTLDLVVAERDRLLTELESRNATLMDAHLRSKKMEEDLLQAQEVLRQREYMVRSLKEKEELANIEAWKANKRLSEIEQKYQNIEAMQQPRPQYMPEFNPGELAYVRQQLMQSQRALTESEQNRAVAEAKAMALTNDVTELRRQLEKKQNDNDDVFALRDQLDVYKSDFEAERSAKTEILREKNKIAEDLQNLHRRNQQLQEEIEILRERLPHDGSVRGHLDSRRNQAAGSDKDQFIYKCPKCNFGFKKLQDVENHVIRCIELDDALP